MLVQQVGFVLGETASTSLQTEALVLLFFKIVFLVAAGLYSVFAFVVVRQIHVMKNTLITTFSPVVLTLGYLHLIVAVGVLFMFFVGL